MNPARQPLRFPRRRRLEATSAVDWISRYDHFGPGMLMRRRLQWAADLLPQHMERVLEIGFGSGVFQYELAGRARLSVGLDVHPNAARVRRQLQEDGISCALLRGDGARLPFASKAFDAVVILSSLEFVAEPGPCLAECRRVLRDGGRLVCVRPRHLPWIDRMFSLLMGRDPEMDFSGGRGRAEAAARVTLPEAQTQLRPAFWPGWLAPYEVLLFESRASQPR
jgi:ubiquinone/menaquinone biosynthesis C-methylase UbiE